MEWWGEISLAFCFVSKAFLFMHSHICNKVVQQALKASGWKIEIVTIEIDIIVVFLSVGIFIV